MLYQSYVVWNNKGGTGKTTLTFHLSTEYAIKHHGKNIIVIDMCPQGNISAALLSNVDPEMHGETGDAIVKKITTGEKVEGFDKTVCGYLLSKIDTTDIPCESFLVKPSNYNEFITDNIYLLCGDPNLEVIAKPLEQKRQPMETGMGNIAWKQVTLFIKDFIDKLSETMDKDCIVFIDTSPSFSIYTEMAISGATRIIVPIIADEFARAAVASMLYLIYGITMGDERDERYNDFKAMEFPRLASSCDVEIPRIHLIINNKIAHKISEPAKTFAAKAREVTDFLESIRRDYPDTFVFDTQTGYDCELNEFHTKTVLQCIQLGCPLSRLPQSVVMHGNVTISNDGNPQSIIDRL